MNSEDKAESHSNGDDGETPELTDISHNIRVRHKPDLYDLDKFRAVGLLNRHACQEGSISNVKDELISVHQVFVKEEGIPSAENEVIDGGEVVLDSVDGSNHMLPVVVEETETSIVEEIIQRGEMGTGEGDMEADEPNDEMSRMRGEMLPPLHMKYPGNIPRGRRNQIKYKVISNEADYISSMEDSNEFSRKLIDKNDPRSRLHL
ncbi:hypothetical protein L9F63_005880, partial [Diploptera punctata]